MDLEQFARQRISELLGRTAFEVRRITQASDAEAVHDLRVAIRRLRQALRALGPLFPKRPLKRVRLRLREMMQLAAGVRDLDIALELCQAAGIAADSSLCRALAERRQELYRRLAAAANDWKQQDFSAQWRGALGLKGDNGRRA